MNKRVVVTVAAGAALSITLIGCAGPKEDPESAPVIGNPPTPEPEPDTVVTSNPPAQLPTWEQAKSRHPEGATNPPYPVLVVTPDGGHCFKQWVSPMMGKSAAVPTDRIDACLASPEEASPCGDEIQCPPEAQEILAGRPTNPSHSAPK